MTSGDFVDLCVVLVVVSFSRSKAAGSHRAVVERRLLDGKRFIAENDTRPYGSGQYEYLHPRPNALHVSELTSIAVREGRGVVNEPDELRDLFTRVNVTFRAGLRVRVDALTSLAIGAYQWSFTVRGPSGVPMSLPNLDNDVRENAAGDTTQRPRTAVSDFRKQPSGSLTFTIRDGGIWIAQELGPGYEEIKKYTAGHGYSLNRHFFEVYEDGSHLLTIYTPINGKVENVLQLKDADGNVLLEWSIIRIQRVSSTGSNTLLCCPYDLSILTERTPDGNYIVSMRHANLVFLVSGRTGRILWRLGGGETSDFTVVDKNVEDKNSRDDPPFIGQHRPYQLPNGNILMLDNQWVPGEEVNNNFTSMGSRPYARAVEWELDIEAKTAVNVWQYAHPGRRSGQPSVLISWGIGGPLATEITYEENARIVREFTSLDMRGHRTFLVPFSGRSTNPPRLLLCSDYAKAPDTSAQLEDWTIHMSYNGVTDIAKWLVYVSTARDPKQPGRYVMDKTKSAFEEVITLRELINAMAAKNVTVTDGAGGWTVGDADITFPPGGEDGSTQLTIYVQVLPVTHGAVELDKQSKPLKVPLSVVRTENGTVVLSPPPYSVLCGCYEPDIGKGGEDLEEVIKDISLRALQPTGVVNMAAVVLCQNLCAAEDECDMFSYLEESESCQLRRTSEFEQGFPYPRRRSVSGVISGPKRCT
ncbi:unnamed protein product [Vitrella brassicaformis CCMP3155]|uniref:Apple domain-containing protein n=1 Tax=Vitrella brassicaformis (strain CCMP3155) TaxID=1169540 RepID=A0A0G4FG25_VITBC|nr:unnamed protein product [Vitrella brassicaformis CCMP3155]|eukprot:CEM12195.1 unnamed protein product [Vitrella brassicaformis CCMP3155]